MCCVFDCVPVYVSCAVCVVLVVVLSGLLLRAAVLVPAVCLFSLVRFLFVIPAEWHGDGTLHDSLGAFFKKRY